MLAEARLRLTFLTYVLIIRLSGGKNFTINNFRCRLMKKIKRCTTTERNVQIIREAARDIPVYKKVDVLFAGTAAALMVKQGISHGKLDVQTLRKTLESQGVNLRKDAIDLSEVRGNIKRRGAAISRII